jgi:hypothetical protein
VIFSSEAIFNSCHERIICNPGTSRALSGSHLSGMLEENDGSLSLDRDIGRYAAVYEVRDKGSIARAEL